MSTVDPRVWRIGTVTVLGSVMSVLDTTIVNVALEPLARELDSDLSAISWVVTAYLLAIAAVTPAASWAPRPVLRLGVVRRAAQRGDQPRRPDPAAALPAGVRGESATTTGLLVAPTAIGVVLVMRRAGRLTDRHGGGRIAAVGTAILTVATVPLAWIDPDTSYWFIVGCMFVRGIGTGLAGMPLMAAALTSIEAHKTPDASAQLFVLQRVGGSFGTAALIVVVGSTADFGLTYGLVAALTALSLLPCLALAGNQRRRRRDLVPVPAA